MPFPLKLFLDGPTGLLAFGPDHAEVPLPWGLNAEGPVLTYGSYFDALVTMLGQDEYHLVRSALSQLLGGPVALSQIQELSLVSRKHGAFYHVSQMRARIAERTYSLAINSAVGQARQVLLNSEFALLQELNRRFPFGFIPRVFVRGEAGCRHEEDSPVALQSFIGEWFEDYHEFHLGRQGPDVAPSLKVWDAHADDPFLGEMESRLLYHQAAFILTAYYDPESSSQIYPWHHAAGDFVVRRLGGKVQLRLITVRGYFPLVAVGTDPSEKWIPLVHFFLNLSLRMRLDRLDGTGALAWARAECLRGVIAGFLESWDQKAVANATLPRSSEVVAVLRSFTPEEWVSLAQVVLEDSLDEPEALEFMQSRLEEHATSLMGALRGES